jgi:tetratricopeptide (TPR) repeat protein
MKCEEVKEYLYEYYTLKLGRELFNEVEEHLKTCEQCQQELKELEVTINLLNRAKPPEVPKDFKNKIMDQVVLELIPVNRKPSDRVYLNLPPHALETYKAYIDARDKVSGQSEHKVIPFYKKKPYRFVLQGVVAAMVVIAVATTVKFTLQPGREGAFREVSRGATIKDVCAKAVALYNEGTVSSDLARKEKLLNDALSQHCEDKKVQAKIHNNLADCFESQGKIDTAIEEYKKAIEIDPELATAFVSLGDIYKNKGNLEEAKRFYENGIKATEEKLHDKNISDEESSLLHQDLNHAKSELNKIRSQRN